MFQVSYRQGDLFISIGIFKFEIACMVSESLFNRMKEVRIEWKE